MLVEQIFRESNKRCSFYSGVGAIAEVGGLSKQQVNWEDEGIIACDFKVGLENLYKKV